MFVAMSLVCNALLIYDVQIRYDPRNRNQKYLDFVEGWLTQTLKVYVNPATCDSGGGNSNLGESCEYAHELPPEVSPRCQAAAGQGHKSSDQPLSRSCWWVWEKGWPLIH